MTIAPVVEIFNSNPELLEMLKARLEESGFIALTLDPARIRAGLAVEAIADQHRPAVVVYDVAFPYDRNWRLFQHVRETSAGAKFVITTPNASGVAALAKPADRVIEMGGDLAANLDVIVRAAREAISGSTDG